MAEGEKKGMKKDEKDEDVHITAWSTVVGVNITPEELRRYDRELMGI